MEVATLKHRPALRGPTPFLRLQGDERLVALTRRGNQSAYEVLVARYQARLLGFCRHMLGSKEDAEDVLQEVFAAAFNAMVADDRPINVRPWLYRIARNRSLNHLRKQTAIGVDSMDIHLARNGASTADEVHSREEFRQLVGDVQELPETQRTALLLREIDALSYDQIAQAMETTVPAIKSLLVRARVGLAEAAEARALSCDEVRTELGEVAEGLKRRSAPVRRHVRGCDRCAGFDKKLHQTNRALAAVFPVGPLLLLKKFLVAQGASGAAGAASAAGGTAAAGAAGAGAGGALSAGLATLATKTAAVVAGAAIVTAGAVEVDHSRKAPGAARPALAAAAPVAAVPLAPRVLATTPQPVVHSAELAEPAPTERAAKAEEAEPVPAPAPVAPDAIARAAAAPAPALPVPVLEAVDVGTAVPAAGPVDTGSDVTALPGGRSPSTSTTSASAHPAPITTPTSSAPAPAQPAPAPAQTARPAEPAPAEPAPTEPQPAEPRPAAEQPRRAAGRRARAAARVPGTRRRALRARRGHPRALGLSPRGRRARRRAPGRAGARGRRSTSRGRGTRS